MYNPWTWTKGEGNAGGWGGVGGGTGKRWIKGRKNWGNHNSIINKIYLKKTPQLTCLYLTATLPHLLLDHLWSICATFICTALIASSLKAFWIIWICSMEECLSLRENLMQIPCSTHSGILNGTATQDTGSLSDIYLPHWLVQWGCPCSHIRTAVYSPWLPGYSDVAQTILIMLTMAGFFPDRTPMWFTFVKIPFLFSLFYWL